MSTKRRIAVLTGGRQDYGLLYWTMREIQMNPNLELSLIVAGMHLIERFGMTVDQIERDGFPIAGRIPWPDAAESHSSHNPYLARTRGIGRTTSRLGETLSRINPHILLLLGDRPEILAAATAALSLEIPIAHIHGGESSEGVIDESIRHAVTKMAHIHFASTRFYADRIMRMGEEPWRVHVCGAPGLEYIHRNAPWTKADTEEVSSKLTMNLRNPTLLLTYHPVGSWEDIDRDINEMLRAIDDSKMQVVITYPNNDPGHEIVIVRIENFAREHPDRAWVFPSLSTIVYICLMRDCVAMVGNSSAGIIEAASLMLPTVNVGLRQQGRLKPPSVIDVPIVERQAILDAINKTMDAGFRYSSGRYSNPYATDKEQKPSEVIVKVLEEVPLGEKLLRKKLVFPDEGERVG